MNADMLLYFTIVLRRNPLNNISRGGRITTKTDNNNIIDYNTVFLGTPTESPANLTNPLHPIITKTTDATVAEHTCHTCIHFYM